MVKSPNAYTYSNSTGGGVSGDVMTLTLNGAGGSSIGVSHSAEPFELWMDGKSTHIILLNRLKSRALNCTIQLKMANITTAGKCRTMKMTDLKCYKQRHVLKNM